MDFLKKGRVVLFESLFREFTVSYKIRIRLLGQVYHFSLLICYPYSSSVSVFTKVPNAEVPILDKKTEVNLPNIIIKVEMVQSDILKLNVSKLCRPDKINSQILIELVDLVSKPLALLLNKAMDEGCIPQDCKMAYVSQMFKKGARNKAENYRPISLTSIVWKLMESFVKDSIMTP